MFDIIPIPAFKDNYLWLITNPALGRAAAVVDPGDAMSVLTALDKLQLQLTAILITHHHADHIGGIAQILQRYPVPVYGPALEKIPGITRPLNDGEVITLDSLALTLSVLAIPGHTLGHIAYYSSPFLFCGDTLFAGGCGRVFEGTAQQMHDSLMKLAALPDDTAIYCAHEYTLANLKFALAIEPNNQPLQRRYQEVMTLRASDLPTIPSNLAIEKQTNPFLRTHVPNVIQAAEKSAKMSLSTAWQVFEALRLWKNNF